MQNKNRPQKGPRCGRGEIRTRGAIADTLALQASAFNRSATLPKY
jgi:hypothetical protein